MKTMTTIAAAAAFAMTSTFAFAATNADNTYWSTPDNMDPSVYDMMINPDTKEMRDDDDFAQRMGITVQRKADAVGARVKPNEPCPCGSGKKYKQCCRC